MMGVCVTVGIKNPRDLSRVTFVGVFVVDEGAVVVIAVAVDVDVVVVVVGVVVVGRFAVYCPYIA